MFTGIIEDVGRVKSVESSRNSAKIEITSSLDLTAMPLGASIAVDGACLTITRKEKDCFSADVSTETLAATTLGQGLRAGRPVNIERPLTLNKPLGGHLVTGHVDAVGVIRKRSQRGGRGGSAFLELEIAIPSALGSQIVLKGSIAVDGVSLTVTKVTSGLFGVVLIPHTIRETALIDKPVGGAVNIETDIISKYVERSLAPESGGGVTEGFLIKNGFFGGKR